MFMVREACNPAGVMGTLLADVCATGNYKSQLTSSDDELEGSASWDADEIKTETVFGFFTTSGFVVSCLWWLRFGISVIVRKLLSATVMGAGAQGRFFISTHASVVTASFTVFSVMYIPEVGKLLDHVEDFQVRMPRVAPHRIVMQR